MDMYFIKNKMRHPKIVFTLALIRRESLKSYFIAQFPTSYDLNKKFYAKVNNFSNHSS
jgi:hypothetical protein